MLKKAASSSPIFKKREEMAIIFVLFQNKNEINYLQCFFKQNSILSSCFKSPKTA